MKRNDTYEGRRTKQNWKTLHFQDKSTGTFTHDTGTFTALILVKEVSVTLNPDLS